MNFSRNALIAFISGSGQAILGVVAFAIFAQVLGASTYGKFLLFLAVVTILSAAADLGIDNAVQKQVSSDSSIHQHAASYYGGYLLKFILVVIIVPLILVFQPAINEYLGHGLALYLIPALIVRQVTRFQLKMLHGELKVGLAKIIEVGQQVIFLAGAVVLTLNGAGIVALIIMWIASRSVTGLLTGYYLGLPMLTTNIEALRALINFSKYDSVSSIFGGTLYGWMDTVAIGYFLSPALVTVYEGAWRVGGGVMLLSQAVSTTIFPHVSNWDAEGDAETIKETLNTAIVLSILFVPPAIVGSLFVGDKIIRLLTGVQSPEAYLALLIILVGKIPEGLNDIMTKVLAGIDRPDLPANSILVFAVINIPLNMILTPVFGIVGAAIATVLGMTVATLMNYNYLRHKVAFAFPLKMVTSIIVSALLMAIPVAIVDQGINFPPLMTVVTIVIIGVVSYGFILLGFPPTRELVLKSPVGRFIPHHTAWGINNE